MNNIHHVSADTLFHIIFPYTTFPVFFYWITTLTLLSVVLICIVVLSFFLHNCLSLKRKLSEQTVFLELTPPAVTEKTAYTTQQLFSVVHSLGTVPTFWNWLLGKKTNFSFEIVSTRQEGIRYIIKTPMDKKEAIKQSITSYMSEIKIREIDDYLVQYKLRTPTVVEFKLKKRFQLPLAKQQILSEHDPVAYITGMMTNLLPNELMVFQLIISPSFVSTNALSHKIERQEDVLSEMERKEHIVFVKLIIIFIRTIVIPIVKLIREFLEWLIDEVILGAQKTSQFNFTTYQSQLMQNKQKSARTISPFEYSILQSIQGKIDQPLFEATLRILIHIENKSERKHRVQAAMSSLAPFAVPKYQSLVEKNTFPVVGNRLRLFSFQKRLLSFITNSSQTILSVSEIADLYHFPYTGTTKTENIVKNLSSELPAPLTLKQEKTLDVIFAENTYGNKRTSIGLQEDERSRHVYMIGQTGSGKSTVLFHMAKGDIQKGKGICVIDPHGDLVDDLLTIVPDSRIDDVVLINPFDIKYPVTINLLELTPGQDIDEEELEKELVAESVISIFRRIFFSSETVDAHRIEYILRNTIYTAFYAKDVTLFTIYKLLTNPEYHKKILKLVDDENLKDFWEYEFDKAGNWQQFKMASGVTAKVGRFLYSPIAKRMLEKPTSTIDFDKLLNEEKIILCNLSEGKLGEDTARLLGTTIITKIHLSILKRARVEKSLRKSFYLYIDEFQNFATSSFTKLLSGGRKFGLSVTIAEQSTTQQDNSRITNMIIANIGTVLCFRTASPVDEELMLSQFSPLVQKGEIHNLPRFHFYIKLGSIESQEPFSGITFPINITKNPEKISQIITASRKNYASIYVRPKRVKIKKNRRKVQEEERNLDVTLV